MSTTTTERRRRARDRELLHRTVRQLLDDGAIDEPDEWPVYERGSRPGMGTGWYWTPAGGQREVLGANTYLAHAQLLIVGRRPAA